MIGLTIRGPSKRSFLRNAFHSRRFLHKNVKRVFLIRHGESVGNTDPNKYGEIPDHGQELTMFGREQSIRAGRRLQKLIKNEDVRFFISPYRRSHETYELMCKSLNNGQFSMQEDPRLREQDWGNFQNTEVMKERQKERRRFGVFYYRFPEGESGADVFDRVSSFMETLHRDSYRQQPQNYVLISHGITLRMFLARYYHWDVSTLNKLHNMYNGQIVSLERPNPDIEETSETVSNSVPKNPAFYANKSMYESEIGSRLLLTTVLGSDPPGPPSDAFWWDEIIKRRKQFNPLVGL